METQFRWRRLNGDALESNLKESVENTLKRELALGNRMKVCIGSDSQVKGDQIEFATVIVFLREKKGGFMFVSSETKKQTMGIKERMISEVARSVQVARRQAVAGDVEHGGPQSRRQGEVDFHDLSQQPTRRTVEQ